MATKPKVAVDYAAQGMKQRSIRVLHFFNSAFKDFSLEDNVRSIPMLFDGLKPSQRKALYGMQLRGENAGLLQIERLAAAIAASTDYHHGIGSMQGAITNMAEDYAGANNMNLLVPSGQFGSRLIKEAAAARYILTKFHENFRKVFKKEDDFILEHHMVDDKEIEPKYYLPIFPMMLINGAMGTGTGHACNILQYHPVEIRDACLKVLMGKKLGMGTLTPWFRGFNGTVERIEDTGQVVVSGTIEVVNTTTLRITELPIGVYLDKYKEHLNDLEESDFIKDYEDRSSGSGFDFTITAPRSTTALDHDELMKKFKLISRDTENFTIWNEHGTLERFDTAEDIVERFVAWRVLRYEDRRQKLIDVTTESIRFQSERLRFIMFYLDNVTQFKNKKKDDLIELLVKNNFVDYDALLSMAIWSLTRDRIEELKKKIGELKIYLQTLLDDTAHEMYKRELKEFKYE